jgi:hypothetical protein
MIKYYIFKFISKVIHLIPYVKKNEEVNKSRKNFVYSIY